MKFELNNKQINFGQLNMQVFFEELAKINNQDKKNGGINIFNIMYYGHEEVALHSRFISYLLSSNPRFLELFVRGVLKIENDKFNLEKCKIRPNAEDKQEYEEIDILIINEQKNQAIIIENKIHARPSIHTHEQKESGYRGQLERYYTILTKGKEGIKYEYRCDEDKTFVFHLSLYQKASEETLGMLIRNTNPIFDPNIHEINYYKITHWLDTCIKEESENLFLRQIIEQYRDLLIKMTTDNKKVLEIIALIDKENNWEIAYDLVANKNNAQAALLNKYFKDVKWHTIHRFFTELAKEFKTENPDVELITSVAHKNKKEELKIVFNYNGSNLQIVNDEKGFTLVNLEKQKSWGYFSDKEINDIKFRDFSNKETFHVINGKHRKAIIKKMAAKISEFHENGYPNFASL